MIEPFSHYSHLEISLVVSLRSLMILLVTVSFTRLTLTQKRHQTKQKINDGKFTTLQRKTLRRRFWGVRKGGLGGIGSGGWR